MFRADGLKSSSGTWHLQIAIARPHQRSTRTKIAPRKTGQQIIRSLPTGDLRHRQFVSLGNRRSEYRIDVLDVAFHAARRRASRLHRVGRRAKDAFVGIQQDRRWRHAFNGNSHHVRFDLFDTGMGAGNCHVTA
jgi:hypothetical protein